VVNPVTSVNGQKSGFKTLEEVFTLVCDEEAEKTRKVEGISVHSL